MEIGILALQGDFIEHFTVLQELGVAARLVKLPAHLNGLDGLIIPGGESTTIGKLAVAYDLMEPCGNLAERKRFGAPALERSSSPRMPSEISLF